MAESKKSRVTGIGGIFFKSADPRKLLAWYEKHLGIVPEGDWGAAFKWREFDDAERTGCTIWSPMSKTTTYFDPSSEPYMINYRVADLRRLIEQLRGEGVDVTDAEQHPQGLFAWATDPEGRRIELWQPPD
ncbi:MAG: VOC family protein [Calditrichaeota bacterium]|nr:MAG: VOC family protein [Calditrichota bacterium]